MKNIQKGWLQVDAGKITKVGGQMPLDLVGRKLAEAKMTIQNAGWRLISRPGSVGQGCYQYERTVKQPTTARAS